MGMFINRNGLNKKKFAQYREKHMVALGRIASDSY
jgi:hypothetical protein